MVLRRASAGVKKLFPRWIWSPARNLLTGLWTPVRFGLRTGHFRSSLLAAAVDRRGKPLPWYTYPAIDFLGVKDFSARTVLEFGSGQSTLWWAKRAKRVLSFESDPAWHRLVRSKMPANAEVFLVPDDLTGMDAHVGAEKFDVVVIDGLDRLKAAGRAVELLTAEGAILLDNSEGYWGGEATNEYPTLQLFRSREFCRVDFYGFAPGVIRPHCTSLFFKDRSFIVRGDENVVRDKLPAG